MTLLIILTILQTVFLSLFLYSNNATKKEIKEYKEELDNQYQEIKKENKIRYKKVDAIYDIICK
jgi:hypothetical protein